MHTATNYYLFSLAISDLLLLLTGVPQELYFIWHRFPYPFGNGVCIMASFAAETSANATVLTITAFTVERYVAICKPFLSHTMSRLSRAVRLVLVIWLIAMGLAIPQALAMQIDDEFLTCTVRHDHARHVFFISTMLVFVSPMSVIIVLYILIGLQLRRSKFIHSRSMHRGSSVRLKRSFLRTHSHRTAVTTTLASSLQELTMQESVTINRGQRGQRGPAFPMDLEDGRVHLAANRTQDNGIRHVVKMLVAVVIAFFLCWAPFHAQRLFAVYANEQSEDDTIRQAFDVLTYVSGILYFLSTCINPVLYNIMSHKFREAFKETLAHYLYRRPSHQLSEDLFFRNASWRSHTNYSHCLTTYSLPPCACSTQFLLPGRSAALQRRPLVVSFRRQKFASLQYHARPGTSSRCAGALAPRTNRSRTDTRLGRSFDVIPLVARSSGSMNLAPRPQRYDDDPSTRSDVRATSTESIVHSDRSDAPAGPVCAECGVHHPAHCRYSTPVTGALRKLSTSTPAPTTKKLPPGSLRASWADACGSSARAKLPMHPSVRRSQSLSVDVGRSALVDDDTTARHEPTNSRRCRP
ncbi:pyrokinin-1 receptor-like [Anopheles cruzii]|uniref:pyrokinin-1 receptor-like n=1 Tax=Anopheles cruzii TaxID=68878 RepID=UPI0022EC7929|nr:pyrokinin-1 receptor-like [Anopheles cruzii]